MSFELNETITARRPLIIDAEVTILKQKKEQALKSLEDTDIRIAGYASDTDPKHANTVANKIKTAEKEKAAIAARIAGYDAKLAELAEERREYFRQKAAKDVEKTLRGEVDSEQPPKPVTVSFSDIVSFLLAKRASILLQSPADKVGALKWLLPGLADDQITIYDADQRTSGGYPMKFGISGIIRVSDLDGLPAGYAGYFNGTAITEINKVVAILRSDFDALSPLIVKPKNHMQNNNENEFSQDFPDINVYGECLTEDPNREYTCCICGEDCVGYGNDPEPYKHSGRCCDACNKKFVIPARAEQLAAEMRNDSEEKEEN